MTANIIRSTLVVVVMFICSQAKGAGQFNADWILTEYSVLEGGGQYEKLGYVPFRERDSRSWQLHIFGGWRIGKDGFCAGLVPDELKNIWGDLECTVEEINGSLIEVRADHPYAAMRCSTIMRLRKVDPSNTSNLIGRSQTSCQNSRANFQFSASVAYARSGSPGLVSFFEKENSRRRAAQEESERKDRERQNLLQRFVGTYEQVPNHLVRYSYKSCSFKAISTTIVKISLDSNNDPAVNTKISRRVEYEGGADCGRMAERDTGVQYDSTDDFNITTGGVLAGSIKCEKCGDDDRLKQEITWLSPNYLRLRHVESGSTFTLNRVVN